MFNHFVDQILIILQLSAFLLYPIFVLENLKENERYFHRNKIVGE